MLSVLAVALLCSPFPAGDIAPPPRATGDVLPDASACFAAPTPDVHFDVVAINVSISYNNFGDHDPFGRMYALASEEAAVRSAVASAANRPVDIVRPLVLRAHVGDCVEVNFTNHLADPQTPTQTLLRNAYPTLTNGVVGTLGSFLGILGFLPVPQPPIGVLNQNPLAPVAPLVPEPLNLERASLHIHKALTTAAMQGSNVGMNPDSTVGPGESITYRWYVPGDAGAEGTYYYHSHGDEDTQVAHGLFGALIAEPRGYAWLDPVTGLALSSGWEAMLTYPSGAADKAQHPDFREYALLFHDEVQPCLLSSPVGACTSLPIVDGAALSNAYGPGTKAINYRSEPFMDRFQWLSTEVNSKNLTHLGSDPNAFNNAQFDEAQAYGSYGNGDPATPIPRAYVGDPTKIRLVAAGPGQHHVYHLHGGGDRWRYQPGTDDTQLDAGTVKQGNVLNSASDRLDVQDVGPGEAFDLEIEGGAGGVQGSVGDFLYHCHIVEHYVAGMWGFWRVYDTLQDGSNPNFVHEKPLQVLPDRAPPPRAVDSLALVGTHLFPGTSAEHVVVGGASDANASPPTINVEALLDPQLPARGVPHINDASVWNWAKVSQPGGVLYLGEPEVNRSWPNYVPQASGLFSTGEPTARPTLQFNPLTGRPAYPMLHPHLGKRPPFAPGHGPTPYLGQEWSAQNPLGLCVQHPERTDRSYNVVAVPVAVSYNARDTDPNGEIFVQAEDKAAVLSDPSLAENLVLRANVHDCVDVTLTSQLKDGFPNQFHSKVNMHIHLVQFDVQASDGVIAGRNFEQSVRTVTSAKDVVHLAGAASAGDTTIVVDDITLFTGKFGATIGVDFGSAGYEEQTIANVDNTANTITLQGSLQRNHAAGAYTGLSGGTEVAALTSAVAAGATSIHVANPTMFVDALGQPKVGSMVGVGLTEAGFEEAQLTGVDLASKVVTLDRPLARAHDAGAYVGYEFVHYRWFPDVELGMVYWHDHVAGIRSWAHGLFGGLVVEPANSTWTDPRTGTAIKDGTPGTAGNAYVDPHLLDIHVPGAPDYREFVAGIQDRNYKLPGGNQADPKPYASFNLRNAPWDLRSAANTDPDYFFSSFVHGDPSSDMLRAYAGDRTVVHLLYAGQSTTRGVSTFAVTGHRFALEQHQAVPHLMSALPLGISSQFDLELQCGAGSGYEAVPGDASSCTGQHAGDYMYMLTEPDLLLGGAWGVFRVYDKLNSTLLPLPDKAGPSGPADSGFPNDVAAGPLQVGGVGVPDPLALYGDVPQPPPSSGNVGPPGAPVRRYDVAAISLPIPYDAAGAGVKSHAAAFVPLSDVPRIALGVAKPEPIVLRANAGEVVEVELTNLLHVPLDAAPPAANLALCLSLVDPFAPDPAGCLSFLDARPASNAPFERVSLAPSLVSVDPLGSAGLTVGYDPDFGVLPGQSMTYRWYADQELGAATLADLSHVPTFKQVEDAALTPLVTLPSPTQRSTSQTFNSENHLDRGLFGMLLVEPAGSTYRDPYTGLASGTGIRSVVVPPTGRAFREYAVMFESEDRQFQSSTMPYDPNVEGVSGLDYASAPWVSRVGVVGESDCTLDTDQCRSLGIREV
ncbi:MAG: multicopper oxidase domain-containing protein, partial [Halobacteriales archaeon]|nr:multicopper oxidase domain-containing protein [Halobacteriales archaeon]